MASRARDPEARRARLLAEARALAAEGGWDAVTTRRLADLIGYTQPVIYGHFPGGKAEIMRTVALAGFAELTGAMTSRAPDPVAGLRATVRGYLSYAEREPAVYEAMFTLPAVDGWGTPEAASEMRAAFDVLLDAVSATAGPDDAETRAELLWSTVHGLALLERHGRLRPPARSRRRAGVVDLFAS